MPGATVAEQDHDPPGIPPGRWDGAADPSIDPPFVDGAQPHKFALEFLGSINPVLTGGWLIRGLLPSSGLAVLYGAPGSGKSFAPLDAALHIAAGRPWTNRKVPQTAVVYVAPEGGGGFRKRVFAAKSEQDVPADVPFALVVTAPNLCIEQGDAATLISDIRAQCAASDITPGLVVLDTLAWSMTGADESSAKSMGCEVAPFRWTVFRLAD